MNRKIVSIMRLADGTCNIGDGHIVVPHDMAVAEQTDRIITMRDGRIAGDTGVT